MPLTEYIALTKCICGELGENTEGKDCTEIYQKTKEILQCYKDKKDHTCNISKEEKEAIKTLREDSSCMVLTADKGVALVVMDTSQYIDKCMALLDDTKVYKPCKDTIKKLPNMHKANCPMHPIVSACGMATYQLAKFLTKILQKYTGITPTFVKDSKYFSEYLRSVNIDMDEKLVSFDISALFTSIPVPTALEVINGLFTEHIEVPEAQGQIWLLFQRECYIICMYCIHDEQTLL